VRGDSLLQNERGLTLVEVLATLTILSIISVVIWNVFFQGLDYSDKAVTQNSMQQESNYLTMKLTRIHQTAKQYELKNSNCNIVVDYINQNNESSKEIINDADLCFKTTFTGRVDPSKEDLPLTISIHDKNNAANEFVMETIFYRLKEDQSE
jgi:prepilin-type N-terminal cleavage/methylation domain-containing protein